MHWKKWHAAFSANLFVCIVNHSPPLTTFSFFSQLLRLYLVCWFLLVCWWVSVFVMTCEFRQWAVSGLCNTSQSHKYHWSDNGSSRSLPSPEPRNTGWCAYIGSYLLSTLYTGLFLFCRDLFLAKAVVLRGVCWHYFPVSTIKTIVSTLEWLCACAVVCMACVNDSYMMWLGLGLRVSKYVYLWFVHEQQ